MYTTYEYIYIYTEEEELEHAEGCRETWSSSGFGV